MLLCPRTCSLRSKAGVAKLPGLHKDPFDRLLIAQSVAEPLRFLTADTALKAYGDLVAVAD